MHLTLIILSLLGGATVATVANAKNVLLIIADDAGLEVGRIQRWHYININY